MFCTTDGFGSLQPYMHFQPDSLQYNSGNRQQGNLIYVDKGEQRLIQSPNGQQTLVKPQLYEKWLESNEPKPSVVQNMQYDNSGYTEQNYIAGCLVGSAYMAVRM
jgi:hypothetical protein